MASLEFDRNHIRRLIDKQLRTDEDLNAFCLDFFPDVYRRFSNNMERMAKVNLLLSIVSHSDQITEKLLQRSADRKACVSTPSHRYWLFVGLLVIGTPLLIFCGLAILLQGSINKTRSLTTEPSRGPQQANGSPASSRPSSEKIGWKGISIDHEGDIQANGSVLVTMPQATSNANIRTRGKIEAGGDVIIGVTPKGSSRK